MENKKMPTLENHFRGFTILLSVFIVRMFDNFIYETPILIGMLLTIVFVIIFVEVSERIPYLKKEISKKLDISLIVFLLVSIYFVFFVLKL
jgi:Na+/citrate or Na+/malate symporter